MTERKLCRLWQSDQDDFLLALLFVLLDLYTAMKCYCFCAKGAITLKNFYPIIISVPFLALCMMGNNVIRAEGKAKFAMDGDDYPLLCQYWIDILYKIYAFGNVYAAWLQPYPNNLFFFLFFVFYI
jgi:hypothetical protein